MNLDSDIIAIVGPNDAGKTSVLEALEYLNDANLPIDEGDITRGLRLGVSSPVIEGQFVLDEDDKHALAHLSGGTGSRWYSVIKTSGGTTEQIIEPPLRRDLKPRERARARLRQVAGMAWPKEIMFEDDDSTLHDWIVDLEGAFTADTDSVDGSVVADAVRLASFLDAFRTTREFARKSASILQERLMDAVEAEWESHPDDQARAILWRRKPGLVLFSADDRSLSSDYDLDEVTVDPPRALANLARSGSLDLDELFEAIRSDDPGRRVELLEDANRRLAEVFSDWRQANVTVRFEVDGSRIQIQYPSNHMVIPELRSEATVCAGSCRSLHSLLNTTGADPFSWLMRPRPTCTTMHKLI